MPKGPFNKLRKGRRKTFPIRVDSLLPKAAPVERRQWIVDVCRKIMETEQFAVGGGEGPVDPDSPPPQILIDFSIIVRQTIASLGEEAYSAIFACDSDLDAFLLKLKQGIKFRLEDAVSIAVELSGVLYLVLDGVAPDTKNATRKKRQQAFKKVCIKNLPYILNGESCPDLTLCRKFVCRSHFCFEKKDWSWNESRGFRD